MGMTETSRPGMAQRLFLPFPQHQRTPKTQAAHWVSFLTLSSSHSPELITHCPYHLCPSF